MTNGNWWRSQNATSAGSSAFDSSVATQATSATVDPATREMTFKQIAGILSETIKARQEKREDDLISRLLDANIDGRNPTFHEMLGYSLALFIGGLETVVNALSFGVRHLARDQELQAKLRADPSLLPGAIEELLRLHGIASTVRRVRIAAWMAG